MAGTPAAGRGWGCVINFYKGGENVTPRNLYRYKLGKIIMTEICIGIS